MELKQVQSRTTFGAKARDNVRLVCVGVAAMGV